LAVRAKCSTKTSSLSYFRPGNRRVNVAPGIHQLRNEIIEARAGQVRGMTTGKFFFFFKASDGRKTTKKKNPFHQCHRAM